MSHTPQQIADLARAALAAYEIQNQPNRPTNGEYRRMEIIAAYMKAVRDPATVLALCERLDATSRLLYEHPENAMNHPLTPTAPLGLYICPGCQTQNRSSHAADCPTAPRAGGSEQSQ